MNKLIFSILLIPFCLNAQSLTVLDNESLKPIPNANVEIFEM